MAQTILCDAHNGEHPGDWIVTHLEDGETLAYCNAAYAELMASTAAAMAQAEADQAAAEAEARLAAAGSGNVGTTPAHVVKRGTSSSRKVHEARRRSKIETLASGAHNATTGPDDDEDDDEDAAASGHASAALEAGGDG